MTERSSNRSIRGSWNLINMVFGRRSKNTGISIAAFLISGSILFGLFSCTVKPESKVDPLEELNQRYRGRELDRDVLTRYLDEVQSMPELDTDPVLRDRVHSAPLLSDGSRKLTLLELQRMRMRMINPEIALEIPDYNIPQCVVAEIVVNDVDVAWSLINNFIGTEEIRLLRLETIPRGYEIVMSFPGDLETQADRLVRRVGRPEYFDVVHIPLEPLNEIDHSIAENVRIRDDLRNQLQAGALNPNQINMIGDQIDDLNRNIEQLTSRKEERMEKQNRSLLWMQIRTPNQQSTTKESS